jgi:hypothetical protein
VVVTPIAIAVIVFACTFAGSLLGMALAVALPPQQLSKESKDVVTLGIGMIATTTALVLGLVIASAKGAFDTQDKAVKQIAADVLTLDRMLARYGPETKEVRDRLRRTVTSSLAVTWPENGSRPAPGVRETAVAGEAIEDAILELIPKTDAQRWLRTQALDFARDVLHTRWLVFGGTGSSVPAPFLVVVVCWLVVIFGSFGLFAPRNATVVITLLVCAMSVAASVFLIMEMDRPFEGVIKISSAPLEYALSHLGR